MDLSPARSRSDDRAQEEGRMRGAGGRRFRLEHRGYDGERTDGFDGFDGFDHDIGAVLASRPPTRQRRGAALRAVRTARGPRPGAFAHPGETGDPTSASPGSRTCRKAAPPVVPVAPPSGGDPSWCGCRPGAGAARPR
ncbi:hypothetical protein ACWGIU_17590, partial [Streptomyces sp. NPDC054840]